MYEQDRRDTEKGRDLDEKTAAGPRRSYETTRLSAGPVPEPAREEPTAVTPALPPQRPRRHRYADETVPDASAAVPASPPVPVPAPTPQAPGPVPVPDERTDLEKAVGAVGEVEVDRAQLNRIAQFFRGAEHEKAKDRPLKAPVETGPNLWDTSQTRDLRPYSPELTGEQRVNGNGKVENDEAVLIAVRELPGVHDADLYTDPTGARRLRLDLDSAADPDAVSAKATRLLADRLGVRAMPRTTQQFSVPRPSGAPANRIVVEQVQVSTAGFETSVEVGLNVDGQRAVGRAVGPAVDWHVLRTAADATIDAVSSLLGERGRCVVEHASVVPAGALRVAVVVVLLLTEAGAEQLAGAAPVAGDNRQAMVHATMSALNRRLEVILP